jgi:hypothetical protein
MLQKIQAVWEFYAPWQFQADYKVKISFPHCPKNRANVEKSSEI